jgi:hypothetical protein
MKEEIKKILENKCDLIVQDREVDNKLLKHWKLAGIIHSNNIDSSIGLWYNSSLKVILDSGNTMWAEKFQLALVSSNFYNEIMVLINPGESDFYALTDYEDIILLLETEFISPFIESEKPSLSITSAPYYIDNDKDTTTAVNNYGNVIYTTQDYPDYSISNNQLLSTWSSASPTDNNNSISTINNLNSEDYYTITTEFLNKSDSVTKNINNCYNYTLNTLI